MPSPLEVSQSGATLWEATARTNKLQDDDIPTNACPHLNLIRVGIDADKVPATVKSRVHHHMPWINGLQSCAPSLTHSDSCPAHRELYPRPLALYEWEIKWRRRGSTVLCVRTYDNFIAVRVREPQSLHSPARHRVQLGANSNTPVISTASSPTFFFRGRSRPDTNDIRCFVRWNRLCTSGPNRSEGEMVESRLAGPVLPEI